MTGLYYSAAFYLFLKVKSELASCLLTQGTFKKSLIHCYRKACRRCPGVDRALQKDTPIADDHAKKLSEASVSLKWTVFKLCCPAHLFPNTPCMSPSLHSISMYTEAGVSKNCCATNSGSPEVELKFWIMLFKIELGGLTWSLLYTVKKVSHTKLSLGGNELFLPRESLVSDIPAAWGRECC